MPYIYLGRLTDATNTPDSLSILCSKLKWEVGFFGGRRLRHVNPAVRGSISYNDLVKTLDRVAGPIWADVRKPLTDIRELDRQGHVFHARNANFVQKLFTWIKRKIGNCRYNRNRILNRIQRHQDALLRLKTPAPVSSPLSSHAAHSIPSSHAVAPVESAVAIPPLTEAQKTFLDQDPFIHGTSSAIFSMISKTEMKLLPIWELLQKGLAPKFGELFFGGMDRIVTDNPVRFGRVNKCSYNLRRVLSYAFGRVEEFKKNELEGQFFSELESCHLTLALLVLTRAKQQGISLIKANKEDLLEHLNEIREIIRNYYLATPFVAKFVVEKQKFSDISHFDTHFMEAAEGIDLEKYVDAESLPMDDVDILRMKAKLEEKGYSLLEQSRVCQLATASKRGEDDVYFSLISISNISSYLKKVFDRPNEALSVMPLIKEKYTHHIQKIDEHFRLMKEALFPAEVKALEIDPSEQTFIDQPFGVIFLCDSAIKEEKMEMLKSGEYAAKGGVELGKEIKMIAVEAKYMDKVRAYLQNHGIDNVDVIARESLLKDYLK